MADRLPPTCRPRALAFALLASCLALAACASSAPATVVPTAPAATTPAPASPPPPPPAPPVAAGDPYQQMVARAEAGDETVDFLALRLAYLESPEYARGRAASGKVAELREAMFKAMSAKDVPTVRAKAAETLKLIYVDLEAQKARYQSCEYLHDEVCAVRGKRVEMGLLKSLVSTGNGHSCATGWQVVTVDEEYFILHMLGLDLRKQSLVNEGGHECDKMDVTDEKKKRKTYYFDIGAMMTAQQKLLDAREKELKK